MRPTMRFVLIKTTDQQATVLLHRGRERLVRQCTGLVNALRGHLAEPVLDVEPEAAQSGIKLNDRTD